MNPNCLLAKNPIGLADLLTGEYESPAMYWCRITPDDARMFLRSQHLNRGVKKRRIKRLAADIASGRWSIDGNSIGFTANAKMVNGQHRMWSIIEANKPICTFVFVGIEESSLAAIDDVASRSLQDHLQMNGVDHASFIAPVVRLLWGHSTKSLYEASQTGKMTAVGDPTFPQLLGFFADNPNISNLSLFDRKRSSLILGTQMAFLHYIMDKDMKVKFVEFCDMVNDGVGLKENMPAFLLRRRMIEHKTGNRNAKIGAACRLALTIRAWNYHVSGRNIQQLHWKINELMPIPITSSKEISRM